GRGRIAARCPHPRGGRRPGDCVVVLPLLGPGGRGGRSLRRRIQQRLAGHGPQRRAEGARGDHPGRDGQHRGRGDRRVRARTARSLDRRAAGLQLAGRDLLRRALPGATGPALRLAREGRHPRGLPVLRLRGVFLAIATIGFGEVVRLGFVNWSYTNGALGLVAIPQKTQPWMIWVALAVVMFALARLRGSRAGYALEAIREDEA